MTTNSLLACHPPKKLNLLSLLARLINLKASRCLKVSTGSAAWSIYLDQGKLIYAASSNAPSGRLYQHLCRLKPQIDSQILGASKPVRIQTHLKFEISGRDYPVGVQEYEAICGLVDQGRLETAEAAKLIETLAGEVLESLLRVVEGTYELVENHPLQALPKHCHLDLRPLIDSCQSRLHQHWLSAELDISQLESTHSPRQNKASQALSEHNLRRGTLPHPQRVQTDSSQQSPQKAANPQTTPPYKIACIDDSLATLQTIETFLDDQIFNVVGITNSVSALLQIIGAKPDLILLDAAMPNLDGYELCSLLRRHAAFKQTPIIMATKSTGVMDRLKTRLSGASDSLAKPLNQPKLLKKIGKFLDTSIG